MANSNYSSPITTVDSALSGRLKVDTGGMKRKKKALIKNKLKKWKRK